MAKDKIILSVWLVFTTVWFSGVLVKELNQPWLISRLEGEELKAAYLNVGQGDSILLRTGQGETILIDGGPDLSVLYALGRYLPWYERKIDLLVLTHPDQDHLFGLLAVSERYQIEKVLLTGVADKMPAYLSFLDYLQESGIKTVIARAGESFSFSRLNLSVLWPVVDLQGVKVKESNAASIVIRASYGEINMLLTGDLPSRQEEELMASGVDLSAQVLKAAHHGSKNSTSREWLRAVSPNIVIISVGQDNPYGHPHYRVLLAAVESGAQVLRTDKLGTIFFKTDGKNIWKE